MFELILYNLSTALGLMTTFLVLLFIFGCITFFYIKDFNVNNNIKIKIYGLLFIVNKKDILAISIMFIRTFIIIYALIMCNLSLSFYITMIVIISILFLIFYFKNVIYETINTVALSIIIYFNYQLNDYLVSVDNSTLVQIVRIILIAFSILYTIYLFLKEFEDITTKHKNINE